MKNGILQLGLIGAGGIGRTHIERINNVLQGARVIAISDAFVEGGKKTAAKYGVEFVEDGMELIHRDDIDAIIVTTIDQFHAQYVLAISAAILGVISLIRKWSSRNEKTV